MAPFIFGHRNKIHIINLEKTLAMYQEALKFARQLAANRGTLLFVRHEAPGARHHPRGSAALSDAVRRPSLARRHAHQLQDGEAVHQAAEGDGTDGAGRHLRAHVEEGGAGLTREMQKLQRSLGGIKELSALPDALFIIDVGYQKGAVAEANKLGVPVLAWWTPTIRPKGSTTSSPAMTIKPRHPLYARGMADASSRAARNRSRKWSPHRATNSSKWKRMKRPDSVASTGNPKRGPHVT